MSDLSSCKIKFAKQIALSSLFLPATPTFSKVNAHYGHICCLKHGRFYTSYFWYHSYFLRVFLLFLIVSAVFQIVFYLAHNIAQIQFCCVFFKMCSVCFTQPSHPAASVPFNSTISMCILQHSQTVSAVFLLHSSFFLFFLSFGVFFTTYAFRFSFFSVDQLVHNKHIVLECYLKDKKAHHA